MERRVLAQSYFFSPRVPLFSRLWISRVDTFPFGSTNPRHRFVESFGPTYLRTRRHDKGGLSLFKTPTEKAEDGMGADRTCSKNAAAFWASNLLRYAIGQNLTRVSHAGRSTPWPSGDVDGNIMYCPTAP